MKRSPLKPGRRKRRSPDEAAVAAAWAENIKRLPCRRCGSRNMVEAHHVVAQRHLKQMGLHDKLWVATNGMPLCRRCHERHETATDRIPVTLLSEDNRHFIESLGLEHYVERFYASDDEATPTSRSRHPGWA